MPPTAAASPAVASYTPAAANSNTAASTSNVQRPARRDTARRDERPALGRERGHRRAEDGDAGRGGGERPVRAVRAAVMGEQTPQPRTHPDADRAPDDEREQDERGNQSPQIPPSGAAQLQQIDVAAPRVGGPADGEEQGQPGDDEQLADADHHADDDQPLLLAEPVGDRGEAGRDGDPVPGQPHRSVRHPRSHHVRVGAPVRVGRDRQRDVEPDRVGSEL
jgi:hypothetical protein